MKVAELSRRSGVSIATIKYYLREGLLHAGTASASNQAAYDDTHVHRLQLVRALIEVGGLSIAQVRDVLDAIAERGRSMHDTFAVAHDALSPAATRPPHGDGEHTAAGMRVRAWVATKGWDVRPNTPAERELADVLTMLAPLPWAQTADVFDPLADALAPLAAFEMEVFSSAHDALDRERMVEDMVVAVVAFERAAGALRRLLLEHESAARFRAPAQGRRRRATSARGASAQ